MVLVKVFPFLSFSDYNPTNLTWEKKGPYIIILKCLDYRSFDNVLKYLINWLTKYHDFSNLTKKFE